MSDIATDHLWFLNSLVRIRVSHAAGSDGLSAIEHRVRQGDSPPLHSHRMEDEMFHILEGEFLIQLDGVRQRVGPGAMLLVPKGVVHSYLVESKEGRFVTITRGGDFERLVRAFSRPAPRAELPPATHPTPEKIAALAQAAAEFGIVFHGPPLGGRSDGIA